MTVIELLVITVALIVGLWLVSRIDRPEPTVAEQLERVRQKVITFQLVLVDQMTPALQRATAAIEELALAFSKEIQE